VAAIRKLTSTYAIHAACFPDCLLRLKPSASAKPSLFVLTARDPPATAAHPPHHLQQRQQPHHHAMRLPHIRHPTRAQRQENLPLGASC
jgi:hypothetical protein